MKELFCCVYQLKTLMCGFPGQAARLLPAPVLALFHSLRAPRFVLPKTFLSERNVRMSRRNLSPQKAVFWSRFFLTSNEDAHVLILIKRNVQYTSAKVQS